MNNRTEDKTVTNETSETSPANSRTAQEIQDWLTSYLANLLNIEASRLDVTHKLNSYGLDSSIAIGLIGDLEEWLGFDVEPTFVYDYPTIATMSEYLAAESQKHQESNSI